MKRNIRGKAAAAVAAVVFAVGLGGCGNTQEKSAEPQTVMEDSGDRTAAAEGSEAAAGPESGKNIQAQTASGTAMGRYMESEIAIPEGSMTIHDLKETEDGILRLITAGDQTISWESEDGGTSWEQKTVLEEALNLGEGECYISDAKLSPDGGVFCYLYEEGPGGSFAKILPDGTAKEVPAALPETELGILAVKMDYMESREILVAVAGENELYLLDDESGEVIRTFNEEDKYCGYHQTGDGKIFLFGDDVTVFDYETGEISTEYDVVSDTLAADGSNLMVTGTLNCYPVIMCSGKEEGTLYYGNAAGLYRYSSGGSVTEQLADGKLNSLAKPSISLMSLLALKDGSFLAAVMDESNPKLLHFKYDETVPTVPDTELKVYTLRDNAEVQQAISMFQTRNPKYFVSLETGMSGDDAVTASDALRTLNTEIMAGNGPDILILDGMPMDSYIEKGVLADISGVYNEILEGDGLLENIAGIYRREDAVYAVPTRFKVPLLIGEKEIIDQIEDLSGLGDMAKQLREEDEETDGIVEVLSAYWLQKIFYGVYSPSLLAEDGTLDTEAVTEYLTQLKNIFELNHYAEDEIEYRMMTQYNEPYDFSNYVAVQDWMEDTIKLQLLTPALGYDFAGITSVCGLKEKLDYRLAPAAGKRVFVPGTVIGVSAKSSQVEGAEEFVKFMLSDETQSVNQGGGFPVNKKALDKELFAEETRELLGSMVSRMKDENGVIKEFTFDTMVPSKEETERFKEMIDSLDTPSLTNAVMEELVQEQAGKCITGEITVEEAVNTINQKMSLYLAE